MTRYSRFARLALVLVIVFTLVMIPAQTTMAAPTANTPPSHGVPEECIKFNHHFASKWFPYLFKGRVWANPDTGVVIAAVYVAECGRWLMGIWRNGRFVTHFFPKVKRPAEAGWNYIYRTIIQEGAGEFSWKNIEVRGMMLMIIIAPHPCQINRLLICPSNS